MTFRSARLGALGLDSVSFGATECAQESMNFRAAVTAVPTDSRNVSKSSFSGPTADGFRRHVEKRSDASRGQKFIFGAGVAVYNCTGSTPPILREKPPTRTRCWPCSAKRALSHREKGKRVGLIIPNPRQG
ncbi:MAG: hypothetical protein K0Q61_2408 [Rhodococcus erythropolis]|jgi:hypothetical protein|nr:hypothetical protein [Rhodococcus erythropolis]